MSADKTNEDPALYYAKLLTGHDPQKVTRNLIDNFDRYLLYLVAAYTLSYGKDGESELQGIAAIWEGVEKNRLQAEVEKMEAARGSFIGKVMGGPFTDSEGLRVDGLQKINDAKAMISVMVDGMIQAMRAIKLARETPGA
jgi:hypothetical protein